VAAHYPSIFTSIRHISSLPIAHGLLLRLHACRADLFLAIGLCTPTA
jgi:hypothetical protein